MEGEKREEERRGGFQKEILSASLNDRGLNKRPGQKSHFVDRRDNIIQEQDIRFCFRGQNREFPSLFLDDKKKVAARVSRSLI